MTDAQPADTETADTQLAGAPGLRLVREIALRLALVVGVAGLALLIAGFLGTATARPSLVLLFTLALMAVAMDDLVTRWSRVGKAFHIGDGADSPGGAMKFGVPAWLFVTVCGVILLGGLVLAAFYAVFCDTTNAFACRAGDHLWLFGAGPPRLDRLAMAISVLVAMLLAGLSMTSLRRLARLDVAADPRHGQLARLARRMLMVEAPVFGLTALFCVLVALQVQGFLWLLVGLVIVAGGHQIRSALATQRLTATGRAVATQAGRPEMQSEPDAHRG